MQRTQFCAKSAKNDLKPTEFLKLNFYFETEGVPCPCWFAMYNCYLHKHSWNIYSNDVNSWPLHWMIMVEGWGVSRCGEWWRMSLANSITQLDSHGSLSLGLQGVLLLSVKKKYGYYKIGLLSHSYVCQLPTLAIWYNATMPKILQNVYSWEVTLRERVDWK
jgi:hypothetical protein